MWERISDQCTCFRRLVALDELAGVALCVVLFQLSLQQELLQPLHRERLSVCGEIPEDAKDLLPLRQHLIEQHKLVVFQSA